MARDEKVRALGALPIFKGASLGQLQRVASVADEATVAAGSVLIVRPEVTSDLYVIESGQALISIGDIPVARLGPGDVFGEVPLVHEHSDEMREKIVAETDLRLLVVRRPAFEMLQANAPGLSSALTPAVARHAGPHAQS